MPLTALKLALLKDGRKQFEIARAASMNETRLSRVVRGRAEPTQDEQQQIAEALGLAAHLLFGEEADQ